MELIEHPPILDRHRAIFGNQVQLLQYDLLRQGPRNSAFPERSWHRDRFKSAPGFLDSGGRSGQKLVGDVVIKARFDNQRARAGDVGLVFQCCAPRVCHLVANCKIAASWVAFRRSDR